MRHPHRENGFHSSKCPPVVLLTRNLVFGQLHEVVTQGNVLLEVIAPSYWICPEACHLAVLRHSYAM